MKRKGLLLLLLVFAFLLAGCSDGSGGGKTPELVTKFSYNLTSNANYYIVREYRAYYNGNYSYTVHEMILHEFLKTAYSFRDKTGSELCEIARSRSYTPVSKTKYVFEGDKTQTINATLSDGTTQKITMSIPDGTAYETWIYN